MTGKRGQWKAAPKRPKYKSKHPGFGRVWLAKELHFSLFDVRRHEQCRVAPGRREGKSRQTAGGANRDSLTFV